MNDIDAVLRPALAVLTLICAVGTAACIATLLLSRSDERADRIRATGIGFGVALTMCGLFGIAMAIGA